MHYIMYLLSGRDPISVAANAFYSGLLHKFAKLCMVQFIFPVVSVKFHYLKVVLKHLLFFTFKLITF